MSLGPFSPLISVWYTGIDYYIKEPFIHMGAPFEEIAASYRRIEALSKRLEMTDELIDLLSGRTKEETEIIIRLTKGEVRPSYEGLDLGVAEKLALKALYMVTLVPLKEIEAQSKEKGDIGSLAEALIKDKKQMSLFHENLTIERVFSNLEKIARAEGKASQDLKLKLIAELLHDSTSVEARYIARIVCAKMRLGIADMTVIDALSYLFTPGFQKARKELQNLKVPEPVADLIDKIPSRRTAPIYDLLEKASRPEKNGLDRESAIRIKEILENLKKGVLENREKLVRIFNIHPDLGSIGKRLVETGIDKVTGIGVRPGIPLRSMLGERLSSVEDILEKMGGSSAFEYKYDGLRVQVHICIKDGNREVRLFSRQLEDITDQFPDVKSSIENGFRGNEAIVEGECVPLDPEKEGFLPFQVISRRRGRKYELTEKIEEIPVLLVVFDCLYSNGMDMTRQPYIKRREELASVFPGIDQSIEKKLGLALSRMQVVEDPEQGYDFFDSALRDGCEGIMAKSVSEQSIYQAGSRGWLWIKYKQDYRTELSDTLDLVVIGAFHGTGRRKGTYGALLMAAFDKERGIFRTVCKLGSGFNDEHLAILVDEINALKGPRELVWKNVDSKKEPDIHVRPELVLEVLAAEITFSPVHTCSFGKMKENAGLALRFPRFTGRFRRDKGPMDATTEGEVMSLYSSQRKVISEKDPS